MRLTLSDHILPVPSRRLLLAAALCAVLDGCALAPAYEAPAIDLPAGFKEAGDWVPATPADDVPRGAWWTVFNDPVLNDLAASVQVSNQNVAAAGAAYAQARALVAGQRAALFPAVSLDAGADRSSSRSTASGAPGARLGNSYQVSLGGSWEPDLWGRLRGGVQNAAAQAQASAADLALATLSAQGELAANYLNLRETDIQAELLRATIAGYERVLQITQNRYDAGVAPKTDLLQSQTQLATSRADLVALQRQRAQLEHAIAVLLGKAPAEFSLAPAAWQPSVPDIPLVLPATLLQRRPDIAAAERRVAAANAAIGVARAGYFPGIGLSASYGYGASRVGDLFNASAAAWSLGLSLAQRVFDAGAVSAQVASARAAHERTAAQYRQTVLAAFQGVEDQLAASRVLAQQLELRRTASSAADQAEQQVLNRYRAGQVSYTEVVTAQATALQARRTLAQLQADRQIVAVALIQALGGGWTGQGTP
ncbi:efflux transporter outer membrane subunit [Noviherbaspirillum soli]|uniref:efflux transporter outer membrane subunit n=1 Tax=Noviherbaspirillum soli TaxID=1064518 RepID=UPI00188B7412|nr:efflux transporter outer membrane subunit [Noviherbaspirillum soli]